jgi:hypothetical protein
LSQAAEWQSADAKFLSRFRDATRKDVLELGERDPASSQSRCEAHVRLELAFLPEARAA